MQPLIWWWNVESMAWEGLLCTSSTWEVTSVWEPWTWPGTHHAEAELPSTCPQRVQPWVHVELRSRFHAESGAQAATGTLGTGASFTTACPGKTALVLLGHRATKAGRASASCCTFLWQSSFYLILSGVPGRHLRHP